MRTYLLLFLLFGTSKTAFAQTNETPLFRPGKITYFNAGMDGGGWELLQTASFTYNTNGDALTIATSNGEGIPSSKDSMSYTSGNKLQAIYKKQWNISTNQYEPTGKLINIFDEEERLISAVSYSWNKLWELESGTEYSRTWNEGTREEIIVTKTYNKSKDVWVDVAKVLTVFNSSLEKESSTTYFADSTGAFENYTRESFGGWFNHALNIYKSSKKERYENGAWTTASQSAVSKAGELWLELEERFWGPTAGTYRHYFSEDGSFHGLMKANAGGWMSLMEHSRTGKVNRIVQNDFTGDILNKAQIDESEVDAQSNLIRTTQWVKDFYGTTSSFYEVLHEIKYDERNLPLVDSSAKTSIEGGVYHPFEKIVYADYVDVRLTTATAPESTDKEKITLYPNPGNGLYHILNEEGLSKVAVYNSTGQWLLDIQPQQNSFDLTQLPKGLYQLLFFKGQVLSGSRTVVTTGN